MIKSAVYYGGFRTCLTESKMDLNKTSQMLPIKKTVVEIFNPDLAFSSINSIH